MTPKRRRQKNKPYPPKPSRGVQPAQPAQARPVQPKREITVTELQATSYSGPIPSPDMLEGYDRVLPGAADRIIRMTEQQSAHRQSLERTVVEGGNRRANQGLWLGAIIAVIWLGASVGLIINGYSVEGTILGGTEIPTLAGVFVYGRRAQEKERKSNLL